MAFEHAAFNGHLEIVKYMIELRGKYPFIAPTETIKQVLGHFKTGQYLDTWRFPCSPTSDERARLQQVINYLNSVLQQERDEWVRFLKDF